MKKSVLILMVILLLASFYAGAKWNQIQYNDLCLDLGGGIKPGKYPICVVIKKQNNTLLTTKKANMHFSWDLYNKEYRHKSDKQRNYFIGYSKLKTNNKAGWIETIGTVKEVEKMIDGTFAYILVYKASQSSAKDIFGKPINGVIEQNIFNSHQKVSVGDKIKLRYKKDEPIIFELLEYK